MSAHRKLTNNQSNNDKLARDASPYNKLASEFRQNKRVTISSRTNINAQRTNIENISNSISGLLSVVKNSKPRCLQSQLYENQTGFQQYRKRILLIEKTQQKIEKEEHLILENMMENYKNNINSEIHRKIQKHVVSSIVCGDQLHEKIDNDDNTPISRPTIQNQKILRPATRVISRSPNVLLKVTSRYVNQKQPQYSKYCRKQPSIDEKPSKPEPINEIKENQSNRNRLLPVITQFQSFSQSQEKAIPSKEIEKDFQEKSDSGQNTEQKRQEFVESEVQNLPRTLKIQKQITFNQDEHRKETPIDRLQESIQKDYQPEIELKVYPCDLTKETIKAFIANRLAAVVKIDIEFENMKCIFVKSQFKEKVNLSQKKFHLLRTLWDRGLFVDQKNLDSLIDFNVDVEEYAGDLKINQDQSIFEFLDIFVNKYLEAEHEWGKKVVHMLTTHEVKQTFFKPGYLDLQNRGFLKLEDLACFINMHRTDSAYFKNKQIKQVFWRFCRYQSEPEQLSYEGLMRIIEKKI